ncbi:MAG TPA: condensation domain-containing protein, partial [Blastocatellia bacterium]|nr:condensation domain-containing protein [Blastocatellia bacterium]
AGLVVAESGAERDPDSLFSLILDHNITAIDTVPVMLGAMLETGALSACRGLRRITSGGEELKEETRRCVFEQLPWIELANLYGPAEATIGVTYYRCGEVETPGTVPVGRPVTNSSVYVMDAGLHIVPMGAASEICIGGDGVALGYLNRSGLTAERFSPDSYAMRPGSRLYRTGDRGRYLADGNLEYLGRLDRQIKIRGYRIELGEIEARLKADPTLREAVVTVREENGEKQLTAYVTSSRAVDAGHLKSRLAAVLPGYMVPRAIVVLDQMPLTASGKIDRGALPLPDQHAYYAGGRKVEPETAGEIALAAIWRAVLRMDAIGVTDNFFELGGDSIIGLQVAAKAKQSGLDLGARDIFRYPTVREQSLLVASRASRNNAAHIGRQAARLISQANRELLPEEERIPPRRLDNDQGWYDLTPTQQGMLFHTIYEGEGGLYITQLVLGMKGPANALALERAWQQVTARHPALRTSFQWQGVERPRQTASNQAAIRIEEHDWREIPEGDRPERLREYLNEDRQKGFDLARAPLMRFALIRTGDQDYEFLWTSHHLLMDGWSVPIVLREVFASYDSQVRREERKLEESAEAGPVTFRDYVEWLWQQDHVGPEEFWTQQLEGLSQTPFPPEFATQASEDGAAVYGEEEIHLSDSETAVLYRFAKRNRTTVSAVLASAWALLLSRY